LTISRKEKKDRENNHINTRRTGKQDLERYQSAKKDYYKHDTDGKKCSIAQYDIECDYFPDYELGRQKVDGKIFYDVWLLKCIRN
jgi:hypothetical protein